MRVELWASVAGADGDGFVDPFTQGFEDLATEVLKVADCFQ